LGIESTAHTFGAAVVSGDVSGSDFKIRSDVRDVYKAPEGSGIHPREASRHHSQVSGDVIEKAIREAGVAIGDLDFVAYSAGPGLGPCLRIGAVVARSLASYYNKPLVPVNHAIGHIELGKRLTGLEDPMVLLISGGHTALAGLQKEGWRIFGETLDLTLGQLLDQLGRYFGLSSPAGPAIEKLAATGRETGQLISLPYVVKGNDVSYSGLLSAAKELHSRGSSREAVSYSVQEYAFAMLTEATERALAFADNQSLLVTGGVAANQRLAAMLNEMCAERGVKLGVIAKQFAGDCGSQIGAAGLDLFHRGLKVEPIYGFIKQSWRLDRVNLGSVSPSG